MTSQTTGFHTRLNYRCDKTVFLEVLAFVGVTFFAQVVLTMRSDFFDRDTHRANGH